jgi:uncharacterized RDD family membrane protein YckC
MSQSEPHDPYAPPRAEVEGVVSAAPRPVARLAHPLRRLVAVLLDGFLLVPVLLFGVLAVELFAPLEQPLLEAFESEEPPLDALLAFLAPFVVYGAVNLVLLHRRGATLGKLALSLRILRRDGRRAELWRIVVLRYVVLAVAAALLDELVLGLGMLLSNVVDPLFIFSRHHRTLHDRLADTIVVRTS